MTICRSVPTDFCLRRAAQAQASDVRQTSPVSASSERPARGLNSLTAKGLRRSGALGCDFSPAFQGKAGETGALAPLFPASVGVISGTRQMRLACVERRVSLPFRLSGKNFPCRRSLVTAPLGHQPFGRYGKIANEPGSARCPFANLPCRQGKLGKAVGVPMLLKAMDAVAFARLADGGSGGAPNRTSTAGCEGRLRRRSGSYVVARTTRRLRNLSINH
jgi:hypothetical protein